MDADKLMSQIQCGNFVTLVLKNGREISGTVSGFEGGELHLMCKNGLAIVTAELIGAVEATGVSGLPIDGRHECTVPEVSVGVSHPNEQKETDDGTVDEWMNEQALFDAQTMVATLSPEPIVFHRFDSNWIVSGELATVRAEWDRAKSMYEYAAKMGDKGLSRLRPVADELARVAEACGSCETVLCHLAYVYWECGDFASSRDSYCKAALTGAVSACIGAAASSAKEGDVARAVFYLGLYFKRTPLHSNLDVVYVLGQLLAQMGSLDAFKPVIDAMFSRADDKERPLAARIALHVISAGAAGRGMTKTARARLFKQLERGEQGAWSQALELVRREVADSASAVSEQSEMGRVGLLADRSVPACPSDVSEEQSGKVLSYGKLRGYGFIRNEQGRTVFFHFSQVQDASLLIDMEGLFGSLPDARPEIFVRFEVTAGSKGLVAWKIRRAPKPNQSGLVPALSLQESQKESEPTRMPNKLPASPKARQQQAASAVPKGSSAYARAKQAQLVAHDLDKAEKSFREAIAQSDTIESAVRDLATVLVQKGRPEEAVTELLAFRNRTTNRGSLDNALISVYDYMKAYGEALPYVRERLAAARQETAQNSARLQLAQFLMKAEQYSEAEVQLREILRRDPSNVALVRSLAICMTRLGKFVEALALMQKRVEGGASAPQDQVLLDAIRQAQETGEVSPAEEIILMTALSARPTTLSSLAEFFLCACKYDYVPPERVQSGHFSMDDVKKLEAIARTFGNRRPLERANAYLSAGRISQELAQSSDAGDLEPEAPDRMYAYLMSSFASRGDAAIVGRLDLDVAREYYAEALSFDASTEFTSDHARALERERAMFRYLLSYLGPEPVARSITHEGSSYPEGLRSLLKKCILEHPQPDKALQGIAYLVLRSKFAATLILPRLYKDTDLRNRSLLFLNPVVEAGDNRDRKIPMEVFIKHWDRYAKDAFGDVERKASNVLRPLLTIEFTQSQLEDSIGELERLAADPAFATDGGAQPFFETDGQRLLQLKEAIALVLGLLQQTTFEEQERLCTQLIDRCKERQSELELAPTRMSTRHLRPVYAHVQEQAQRFLKELYARTSPQVELRLPVESYTPDPSSSVFLQIVVQNRQGCAPADRLQLVIKTDPKAGLFEAEPESVCLPDTLRGGEQRILMIPLRLAPDVLAHQTFSLPVYATFLSRTGQETHTEVSNFAIRLYSPDAFETIENPYAPFCEGGVVSSPEMFFGRESLIANASGAVIDSVGQSKCIIIYGQKRAGKSSILLHLKTRLQMEQNLLVLDLGSVGLLLGEEGTAKGAFDRMLSSILNKLREAVDDRIERGSPPLNMLFPNSRDLLSHPSPLVLFNEVMSEFQRTTKRCMGWEGSRIVLLIDEFSYIYTGILSGWMPESFMKTWKALLQENFFSAVLVGQDFMPRFKQRFANEFGTTQDERVTYLRQEDARQLIDLPIRMGGRTGESRYREQAIERILDLTAGSPFYIQIVCNRLVEYMNRKKARLVTEADVEQVKDELVKGINALTDDKFDNLLDSGDTSDDAIPGRVARSLLQRVAVNSQNGRCSRVDIGSGDDADTERILQDLVRRDVLEVDRNSYYRIRVGLFQDWLLAHCQ